jgi:hypothetical protein
MGSKEMNNLSIRKAIAAGRTLEGLGYTYHDGELWEPPLGTNPSPLLNRIDQLQLENESLKQVARFETDVAAQAIADFNAMKLEVDALRKDAAVYKAIDRACTELPSTHQIEITISKGYGGVKLFDDCLDEVDFDDTDRNFDQQIHSAIDAAIKGEQAA